VALVGDSAHAVVPSYGQGANCGFEDCAVLDACLDAAGGDWARALPELERLRKPNADAIADLSLRHFRELQDLVGEESFLLRKTVERRVNELFPERFVPLYNMVSFTELSYVEALEIEGRQRTLVDRILAVEGLAEALGTREADRTITELVEASGLAATAREAPGVGARDGS
jgi:kynurenine 3-monooxygenase